MYCKRWLGSACVGSIAVLSLAFVGSSSAAQEPTVRDGERRSINGLSVDTRYRSKPGEVLRWVVTYRSGEGAAELEFVREENAGKHLQDGAREAFRCWTSRQAERGVVHTGVFSLSCENKFDRIDGASASAAIATLLHSLSDGFPLAAATGDLSVDGRVLSVGGVYEKARGAILSGCTRLAIPSENERQLEDSVLLYGPEVLAAIEFYGVADLEDVIEVMRREASPARRRASELFAGIHRICKGSMKRGSLKRTAEIGAIAEEITEVAPQHLSARLLLAWCRQKLGPRLTLPRSIAEVDGEWSAALGLDPNAQPETGVVELELDSLSKIRLGDGITRLRVLRPMLHESSLRLAASYEKHLIQMRLSVAAGKKCKDQVLEIDKLDVQIQKAERTLENAQRANADRMRLGVVEGNIRGLKSSKSNAQIELDKLRASEGQEADKAGRLMKEIQRLRAELREDLKAAESLLHGR
jgi:hypothetical protein